MRFSNRVNLALLGALFVIMTSCVALERWGKCPEGFVWVEHAKGGGACAPAARASGSGR